MISPKHVWKNTYVTHVHIVALRILQKMMLQKMTTLMVFFCDPKDLPEPKLRYCNHFARLFKEVKALQINEGTLPSSMFFLL